VSVIAAVVIVLATCFLGVFLRLCDVWESRYNK